MPYIITTGLDGQDTRYHDRRAVATPGDVRDYVHSLGAGYGAIAHLDCVLDGTSRLTVGPLSDGSVIEVSRVSWPYLQAGRTRSGDHDAIIAAYNAGQEDGSTPGMPDNDEPDERHDYEA